MRYQVASYLVVSGLFMGAAAAGEKLAPGGQFLTPATPQGIVVASFAAGDLATAGPSGRPRTGNAATGAPVFGFAPMKQAYATADGVALYTYDNDRKPLESSCYDDCAKDWPPYAGPLGFRPVGDWSTFKRTDGTQQLALRGRPLYTAAGNASAPLATAPSEPPTQPPASAPAPAPNEGAGSGKPVAQAASAASGRSPTAPPPEGPWRVAEFKPVEGFKSPPQISVKELFIVNGQVLVDADGMTLYVSDNDKALDQSSCYAKCTLTWKPAEAGNLVSPVGDFNIIGRNDGLRQWAYKGKPLYRYSGDTLAGHVNGEALTREWHAAKIVDYFMPPGVRLRNDPRQGVIIATADGRTLYARDKKRFSVGLHNAKRGPELRGEPQVGQSVGTSGCDNECSQKWKPFRAPESGQPSAFWSIVTRADGTRQWAYLQYPLYTYVEDKVPGDTRGHDLIDISDGYDALYWRVALP